MLLNLMMVLNFRRQMSLPPRPPSGKISPGRPPPPSIQRTGRSQSVSLEASPKPQAQKPHRKGPVLPPRPNPGHRLYNQYTVREIPLNNFVIVFQIPLYKHIVSFLLSFNSFKFLMGLLPPTTTGVIQENCHFRCLNYYNWLTNCLSIQVQSL